MIYLGVVSKFRGNDISYFLNCFPDRGKFFIALITIQMGNQLSSTFTTCTLNIVLNLCNSFVPVSPWEAFADGADQD